MSGGLIRCVLFVVVVAGFVLAVHVLTGSKKSGLSDPMPAASGVHK